MYHTVNFVSHTIIETYDATLLLDIVQTLFVFVQVLLTADEIDMSTLQMNFGDSYQESYCTPRAFILDLSPRIFADKKVITKFYLICVLRAESDSGQHKYRLVVCVFQLNLISSVLYHNNYNLPFFISVCHVLIPCRLL